MENKIIDIIKKWKEESGIKSIILLDYFSQKSETITICVNVPCKMIGINNELYNKYIEMIKKENRNIKRIEFVNSSKWFIR